MKASLDIHFSDLFADTLKMHGISYCFKYYYIKHKMPLWELEFWINQRKGVIV